jgi:hypothetical protein
VPLPVGRGGREQGGTGQDGGEDKTLLHGCFLLFRASNVVIAKA